MFYPPKCQPGTADQGLCPGPRMARIPTLATIVLPNFQTVVAPLPQEATSVLLLLLLLPLLRYLLLY
jgi:hypothetical protein